MRHHFGTAESRNLKVTASHPGQVIGNNVYKLGYDKHILGPKTNQVNSFGDDCFPR